MARTSLAVQEIDADGVNPAYTAANVDGHSIARNAILHVKNGSGGSINVTIQTPAQLAGLDVADQVVAVPAGEERFFGGFDPATYVRPTGVADPGTVYVDFSAVTSVTVAAFEVVRT